MAEANSRRQKLKERLSGTCRRRASANGHGASAGRDDGSTVMQTFGGSGGRGTAL